MGLSKDDILKPRKPLIHSVDIPEWGGTVHYCAPTLRELEKFETRQAKQREAGNGVTGFRARVAILVCCDEDGKKLFSDSDEAGLCDQPSVALIALYDAVAPLLGWSEKAAEDNAKNSQPITGGASDTD